MPPALHAAHPRQPGPLRALLLGNAISLIGSAMTFISLPWFVLVTTGSAARTGVVAACETVPLVLASALTGPLVDRYGGRRVAVLSDLLSAVGVAAVPLLHTSVGLAFWQLCVLVAFVGLVRAPGGTARHVLLPEMVERSGMPMERATSAYDGVSRGARMLGTPVAGALIAVLGPADVLLIDASSFVISALLLLRFVPRDLAPAAAEPAEGGYVGQLRDGARGLRADRLLLGIVVMVSTTNLLDVAWSAVLMPVYARQVLDSSVALGVVFGAFGMGALIGTIGYGALGPRLPRWPVFTAAFLIVGPPRFFLLAAQPSYRVLLISQVVGGLACGALNPILTAVLLERVRPEMRGRVFGVADAGTEAGVPLGALLAGLLVQFVGLRPTLLLMGSCYLAATLTPVVLHPLWRQMDSTRTGSPPEGGFPAGRDPTTPDGSEPVPVLADEAGWR